MAQELAAVLAHDAADFRIDRHAGRHFHIGRLHGHPVVAVLCGIGKVATATTATLLAERYAVSRLVFTGVAGGLAPGVRVGDLVIGDRLLQHDMDASPLFPRWEVPLTGRSEFQADSALSEALAQAAAAVLAEPGHYGSADLADEVRALGVTAPRLHRGLIVSGDRFVSTQLESSALQQAALAQACHDLGLPFAVLRNISDRADDSAHVDFLRFIECVAAHASAAILERWLLAQARA